MDVLTDRFPRINPEVHLLLLLVFFYGLMVIYMPQGGLDLPYWSQWATYIKQHGLTNIYELHKNPVPGQQLSFIYGPVYMYLLYFFGKWQGTITQLEQNIYRIKILLLIFDMVGVWFALRYVRDKANRPFYALFLLFNISLLYNTVSWGQVDGAIACLALLAFYYALRGDIMWSAIFLIISLLIKPQPIIFLPVLGLLWLTTILKNPPKYTVLSFLGIAIAVFVLIGPYLLAGTWGDYWAMLRDSASIYPRITINAGNVWTLLSKRDTNQISDELVKFGLTYRQWGLLMFSVSYLLVLFPMLWQFYQIRQGKQTDYDTSVVLLVAGLVPILFYFFNTQMHERYAHPCVLLLAAYTLSKGDFIPYIIASVANFFVMEIYQKILGFPKLYNAVTLDQVAILFLLVLVWGLIQLYRQSSLVVLSRNWVRHYR